MSLCLYIKNGPLSPSCPLHQGESISSETSNGYLNEAEASWSAFEEEADTQSTQSTHMDVMTDPHSQGSLLLSHNEALAGIEMKFKMKGAAHASLPVGSRSLI